VHFAVRIALEEKLRRKARLRRKRIPLAAPPPAAPAEPPLAIASQFRESLSLLGQDALRHLRAWKAREHRSYNDVTALLPHGGSLSASELDLMAALLSSLAIELKGAPASHAASLPRAA
jgi:hypothetical protein